MSTAVMSTGSMMFDYGDFFKSSNASVKTSKDAAVAAAAATMASQQMLGVLASSNNPSGSTSGNANSMSNINNSASLRRSYNNLVNLIEQHHKLDRTVSEPTSRYKTELCRPFEESGSCKYGDKCQFAHGYNELRNLARHPKYKTELCRTFHKIGFCPYGPRCHFVHNFEEARIQNLKLAAAASAIGVTSGTVTASASSPLGFSQMLQPLGMNMTLLEQLSSSAAQPTVTCGAAGGGVPLARANSLNLTSSSAALQRHQQYQQQPQQLHAPLHRSSSLGMPEVHTIKPTPLNLSPTLSLGSAADSISPSSSLSQSPTNSMSSFFSDESINKTVTATQLSSTTATFVPGFGQELAGLLRCSPSPPMLSSRTQSPLSPGAESRLPVFNQISSNVFDSFENLKI